MQSNTRKSSISWIVAFAILGTPAVSLAQSPPISAVVSDNTNVIGARTAGILTGPNYDYTPVVMLPGAVTTASVAYNANQSGFFGLVGTSHAGANPAQAYFMYRSTTGSFASGSFFSFPTGAPYVAMNTRACGPIGIAVAMDGPNPSAGNLFAVTGPNATDYNSIPIAFSSLSSPLAVEAVGINNYKAIVAGNQQNNFFAAYVDFFGALQPISLPTLVTNRSMSKLPITNPDQENNMMALLTTTAVIMNKSQAKSFLVDATGSITDLGTETTLLNAGFNGEQLPESCALNANNMAIIVGSGDKGMNYNMFCVAVYGPNQAVLPAAPPNSSTLQEVALNDQNQAIVSGRLSGFVPYLAILTFTDPTMPSTGNFASLPTVPGELSYSVAINNQGIATAIGTNAITQTSTIYVVTNLDNPMPTVTTLPRTGMLFDKMSGGPVNGIGGGSCSGSNAAAQILAATIPAVFSTSSASGGVASAATFAVSSQMLSDHLGLQMVLGKNPQSGLQNNIALLAKGLNVKDHFAQNVQLEKTEGEAEWLQVPSAKSSAYSLWFNPFGEQVMLKNAKTWIGGAIGGLDYLKIEDTILGFAMAYAFNYSHSTIKGGHSKTNQEMAALYGSWFWKHFYLNTALWGGLSQTHNVRHTLGFITSVSNFTGCQLTPHLEMSAPFSTPTNRWTFDPFVMFDWANSWQGHIRERGTSGLNLSIGHQYTSLLRSELGLRMYQKFRLEKGILLIQEKGSWINKRPFHAGLASAAFIGGGASFTLEMFSNQIQNLGAVQFYSAFIPFDPKYPYGSINYQGEFGSDQIYNLLSIGIGKNF